MLTFKEMKMKKVAQVPLILAIYLMLNGVLIALMLFLNDLIFILGLMILALIGVLSYQKLDSCTISMEEFVLKIFKGEKEYNIDYYRINSCTYYPELKELIIMYDYNNCVSVNLALAPQNTLNILTSCNKLKVYVDTI